MVKIPTELCQSEYRVNGSIQYTREAKEHSVVSNLTYNYNLLP